MKTFLEEGGKCPPGSGQGAKPLWSLLPQSSCALGGGEGTQYTGKHT